MGRRGLTCSVAIRRTAAVISGILVGAMSATPAIASVPKLHPPAAQQVPVHARDTLDPAHPAMPSTPRSPVTATAWPRSGSGVADLAGDHGSGVRIESLPLVLRRAAGAAGAHTAAGAQVAAGSAQPVTASVLSRAQAAAAGVSGILFTVAPGSGNAPGQVQVGVD